MKVELELIDVGNVIRKDETGDAFLDLVPMALRYCMTADQYLKETMRSDPSPTICLCCFRQGQKNLLNLLKCDDDLAKQLQTKLNRYVQVHDKYLHLLSLLIKSQAFHKANPVNYHGEDEEDGSPVIELPRTREGKPYIPGNDGRPSVSHFSVSHQQPFVGIARADGVTVGLDIVTFDEINPQLYKTEEEFVQVFRSSFSDTEWQSIVRSRHLVKDFFLQWAIKEAYTKALGLGMSCDFKSFTTKLDGVESLWEYIIQNADPDKGITVRGSVHRERSLNPDQWSFFFLLLKTNGEVCGCACIGAPSNMNEVTNCLSVETSWMDGEDLLCWHQQSV